MMDRATRKYLLDKNGITQAAIARKLKIKGSTVCTVIKGTSESARVKSYIAKILGMTVDQLWPDDDNGDERRAA
jgi:lambda repressor-like predicted transcriptional regulator